MRAIYSSPHFLAFIARAIEYSGSVALQPMRPRDRDQRISCCRRRRRSGSSSRALNCRRASRSNFSKRTIPANAARAVVRPRWIDISRPLFVRSIESAETNERSSRLMHLVFRLKWSRDAARRIRATADGRGAFPDRDAEAEEADDEWKGSDVGDGEVAVMVSEFHLLLR